MCYIFTPFLSDEWLVHAPTQKRKTGQKLRLIKCETFNDGILAFAHLKKK